MSWLNNSVPVLMYHHVLPQSGFITSAQAHFREQMEHLSKNGYKSLTPAELAYFKKTGEKPKNSVMITFDDGWRDNYIYAYPILKEFGLRATIFVITDWIGQATKSSRSSYVEIDHRSASAEVKSGDLNSVLSWDELGKMQDVFDVESHGHTHRDFYFGKECSWDEECEVSKALLRERLGVDSRHFCWPRGKYDEGSREVALNHFGHLYTTERGANMHDETPDVKRVHAKEGAGWLKKALFIYSSSFLSSLYRVYKK